MTLWSYPRMLQNLSLMNSYCRVGNHSQTPSEVISTSSITSDRVEHCFVWARYTSTRQTGLLPLKTRRLTGTSPAALAFSADSHPNHGSRWGKEAGGGVQRCCRFFHCDHLTIRYLHETQQWCEAVRRFKVVMREVTRRAAAPALTISIFFYFLFPRKSRVHRMSMHVRSSSSGTSART